MRVIIITFIILIFGLLNLFNPIRDVFQVFSAPIQFGLRRSAIGLKDAASFFKNLNSIRKENLELLEENLDLKSIVVDLKRAEEENTRLRVQLDLKNSAQFDKNLLLAQAMGNPKDPTGTSLMLDKGSRHGISSGDNVIIGNFLLGIVTEVSGERSVVNLVISPEVSLTVKNAEPDSNAEGIAKGELGTSITVSRLLPGEKISQGDYFITTGKDGRFLPGLTVGTVSDVSFQSADPLMTARLKPLIDFSRVDKVFVILSK